MDGDGGGNSLEIHSVHGAGVGGLCGDHVQLDDVQGDVGTPLRMEMEALSDLFWEGFYISTGARDMRCLGFPDK